MKTGRITAKTIKEIILWCIPVIGIFLQYHAVVLTYGMLILLALTLVMLLFKKELILDRDLVFVGIFITIQQVISGLLFSRDAIACAKAIVSVWAIIVSTGLCVQLQDDFDVDKYYKRLKKIGIILVGVIFVQFVLYYAVNIIPKPIMILPQSEEYMANWRGYAYSRPSGFFSEPSAYAGFIFPFLIKALEKRDYKFALVLSFSLILSTSSQGILVGTFIWGYYLFTSSIKRKVKLTIVAACLIAMMVFFVAPPFEAARIKVFSVFASFSDYSAAIMTNNNSYTNYLRLIKGWVTYFQLPGLEQLIGIGISNFRNYVSTSDIVFQWNTLWSNQSSQAGFFSSAAGVFIECGLIVAILYYHFLYKKIGKEKNDFAKIIILLIVVQSFIGQFFFNSVFTYYLLFYYLFAKTKQKIHIRIGY